MLCETVLGEVQRAAEPGAVPRAAEPVAVQQAAVLCGTVLGEVQRDAEPVAVQQEAELCGAVLQSTGRGNFEVAQAGQLMFAGSFSSFFSKNISLFQKKHLLAKNFHKSKKIVANPLMESLQPLKVGPSHSQCRAYCQKPKKAWHVQDLKAQ